MCYALRKSTVLLSLLVSASYVYPDGTLATESAQNHETEQTAYDVLASHYPSHARAPLLSTTAREELELDPCLNNIDRSVTSCGTWGLHDYFTPTHEHETIKHRQETLHTLLEQPELLAEIRDKLADIQESLPYALSYYMQTSEQEEPVGKELYYNKLGNYVPSLNYSPLALGVGVHFTPATGIGVSMALMPLSYWVQFAHTYHARAKDTWTSLIPTVQECGEGWTQGTRAYVTSRLPYQNMITEDSDLEDFAQLNTTPKHVISGGDTYTMLTAMTGSRIGGALCFALHYAWDIYNWFSIYRCYSELSRRHQEIHHIYHVTFHVSRIIRKAREINDLVNTNLPADMRQELPIAELVNAQHSLDHETAYLNEILSSHTFDEQQSVSRRAPHRRKPHNKYSTGKVLTAHQLLCDSQTTFSSTLAYIGSIDALSGVAQTYHDMNADKQRMCFTTFDADRTTPYIKLDGFWTPLLPADTAVGSDITLDTNNAIFTGPNGIGKSTAMKGVAHSLTLAHTFGIAPAQSAHMSLFDHVGTYLNIREDTQEGLSSFMAEKKRVDEFYEEIPQLQGNTFYIIDEPFRGTFADEAEKRVYKFGEFIDQHPRVMACIATHFAQPTQLSHEHRFANYHIGITENADHSFKLTYRLEPGILDWWFNDPEKRSQFVDWISDHIAETQQHA